MTDWVSQQPASRFGQGRGFLGIQILLIRNDMGPPIPKVNPKSSPTIGQQTQIFPEREQHGATHARTYFRACLRPSPMSDLRSRSPPRRRSWSSGEAHVPPSWPPVLVLDWQWHGSLPVCLSVGREQAHELNRYETTAMGMVPHYPHCFFCPGRSQSLHRVHAMSQPSLSMSIIPERSPIANLLAPWLCQASQM